MKHKKENHNIPCIEYVVVFTNEPFLEKQMARMHDFGLSVDSSFNSIMNSQETTPTNLSHLFSPVRNLLECHQCDKNFSDRASFNQHISNHHNQTLRCPVCICEINSNNGMRLHLRKSHQRTNLFNEELKILPHGVVNDKQEEVELCSSVECKGNLGNLIRHKRNRHEGVRFQCNNCDYDARQKGDTKTHMDRKHSQNPYEHTKFQEIRIENSKYSKVPESQGVDA